MRRLLASLCGLLLAGALFAPAAQAAFSSNSGWQVSCTLATRASNDPIVFPGQPGVSHSHDFFGNKTTDASSTPQSLLGQPTTCKLTTDTAAYWAPTLYVNGVAVQPEKVVAYYRTKVGPVQQAMPAGLKVIAGNGHATAAQSLKVIYYDCDSGPDQHDSALPYACPGSVLDVHIKFPQCWDGVNLDSADHKSHMAYPVNGSCPATHPVSVPQLIMRISWMTQAGTGFTLASGSPYTMHADFMNGWDQAKLQQLTRDCMNAGINCGTQLSP
jgi:hypothetical protein